MVHLMDSAPSTFLVASRTRTMRRQQNGSIGSDSELRFAVMSNVAWIWSTDHSSVPLMRICVCWTEE